MQGWCHVQDKQEQIFHEFERRRNGRTVAVAVLIGTVLVGSLLGSAVVNVGVPEGLVMAGTIVVMVGASVYHWSVWRCPSCDEGLGREWSVQFCPRCGTRLVP